MASELTSDLNAIDRGNIIQLFRAKLLNTTAKPPKTKAEYQKAYREREKAKKNENKLESNAKPPKTKAEYQKEYRERQKAKKNENKQESTAKPPKTNAEHQKAFRERQKMKKIKNKRERKMGKEDKEDSGFGFKDKAKAEETLRLLEEHDMNYRRLTVRGLLGRAKRVLSLTKAEDKRKNITEAMAVFEEWLANLDSNKERKTENKDKDKEKVKESRKDKESKKDKDKENGDKSSESDVDMEESKDSKKKAPETVPGLGFKDKEAAENTLEELKGRDPDYQQLAVRGLIGRAKRVLTCTRDETKVSNIKEALSIFDKFLDDFDTMHLSKQNNPYLSLGLVRTVLNGAEEVTDQQKAFIAAFTSVGGEYKRLRTVAETEGGKTWDIVRNTALKSLKEKHADAKLFNEKDEPTKEHIEMLLWAYSPESARVKKLIPETKDDSSEQRENERKRRSSARDDESPSKKKKD